jgi:exopolysaccharide biosynthesis polyprenyl glycosylphosphotransferase
MLRNDASLGYEVRGFVDDDHAGHSNGHPHGNASFHPMLGTLEETIDAVRKTGSTGVIIAATAMDLGTSNRLIRELTDAGIHVELSSTLRDIAMHRLTVRPLGRFPVVYIEPVQRHGWRQKAKRTFDVAMAGTVLLLTAPLLAVAAIAVKLDSKGPILFKQERVGFLGKRFTLYKFRTMIVGADTSTHEKHVAALMQSNVPMTKLDARGDSRLIPVGRLLRAAGLDELPQLINVLKGEMSLVGPRPCLPSEYNRSLASQRERLRTLPGLTGLWQVSGKNRTTFNEMIDCDVQYVRTQSLWLDLKIMLKTIPTLMVEVKAAGKT